MVVNVWVGCISKERGMLKSLVTEKSFTDCVSFPFLRFFFVTLHFAIH